MRECAFEKCHESLEGKHGNARFCSVQCRTEAYGPKHEASARTWYDENRESQAAALSARRQDPQWREARREKYRAYATENRERLAAYNSEWRLANKDRLREQRRENAETRSEQYRAWRLANPETARESSRRYSARKRANMSEQFSNAEIFERDGWICGLCGEAVERDLEWPHQQSATLDHIVPLSLGGPHSRENSQCAHFSCNAAKGNRVTPTGG